MNRLLSEAIQHYLREIYKLGLRQERVSVTSLVMSSMTHAMATAPASEGRQPVAVEPLELPLPEQLPLPAPEPLPEPPVVPLPEPTLIVADAVPVCPGAY